MAKEGKMSSYIGVSVETKTDGDARPARRDEARKPEKVAYSAALVQKIKKLKKAAPVEAPEDKDEFLRWLNKK